MAAIAPGLRFPRIGDKLVSGVTTTDVLAVLTPIWTAKPSTAKKVRQRIGAVMQWGVAKGYRTDNPAGEAITAALPKNGNGHRHHKAVPHAQVADVLATVRGHGAGVRELALEFLVLTACRVGEVAGARWTEIDGDVWTIPAARVKTKRPHRVPLSSRALAVLEAARALAGDSALIFPGATGKPIPRQAFGRTMKAAGVAGTPHGFRQLPRLGGGYGRCSRGRGTGARACRAQRDRGRIQPYRSTGTAAGSHGGLG